MNKSEVILYISASQDGYIADKNGECDYLPAISEEGYDYGYRQMIESVDSIIMGRTTYDYIIAHSPSGQWPYSDKKCYVYTCKPRPSIEGIEFVNEQPEALLQRIRSGNSKRIWLMVGGEIIRMFLNRGLIDVFDLFYVPILLGDGVPMFPAGFSQTDLVLEKTDTRGGLVELLYRRKQQL
jgi:dihydrofolate reductase